MWKVLYGGIVHMVSTAGKSIPGIFQWAYNRKIRIPGYQNRWNAGRKSRFSPIRPRVIVSAEKVICDFMQRQVHNRKWTLVFDHFVHGPSFVAHVLNL